MFACRQSLFVVTRSVLKELCGRFERYRTHRWLCHRCAEAGPSYVRLLTVAVYKRSWGLPCA